MKTQPLYFYADTPDITFEDVVSVLDGFDSGEKALDIYIEDRGAFASDNS